MRTVELLDQAFLAIKRLGYQIREECVGGSGGGICVVHGQKWFFLDPSLDVNDQFELVCDALRSDPAVYQLALPAQLSERIGVRKSA